MMNLPARYPYNPKWKVLVACAVFFGACAASMIYQATHNRVGLIINGVITLEPAAATAFYWVVAAGAALFVIAASVLTVRLVANPQVLELRADVLLLPSGFMQMQLSRIPYADIQEMAEVHVSGQTILTLTVRGRKYSITASLFPELASYVAVRDFLLAQAPIRKS